MALTVVFTLLVTVLVTVVIPGLAGFRITNTSLSDIRLPRSIQSNVSLPDGYVAYPCIGIAYKVHNAIVTWKTAKEGCISEGAHLAVIDTHLKFDYLMTYPSTGGLIWTSILAMYDDTEWVDSTTGSTVTNLPWATNKPYGGYDCVATQESPRGLGDYPCNNGARYACELPIPENYNAQRTDEKFEIIYD